MNLEATLGFLQGHGLWRGTLSCQTPHQIIPGDIENTPFRQLFASPQAIQWDISCISFEAIHSLYGVAHNFSYQNLSIKSQQLTHVS